MRDSYFHMFYHVFLLSLNLLCKHYNCEPLNTFTARRHQPNARKNNKQVLVFKHDFTNLWKKRKQHKMPLFNFVILLFFLLYVNHPLRLRNVKL